MESLLNNKNLISSSVILFRNVKGINFPITMKAEEGKLFSEKIIEKILDIKDDMKVFRLWNDEIKFEKLKETRVLRNKTLKNKEMVAYLESEKNNFKIILNEEEHIRLQCTKSGYNIEEIYNYVKEFDMHLERKIDYLFDETMGYLTSNPNHIGTGLILEVMVHLPMLTLNDKISKLFSHKDKSMFELEGKYGEKGKAYGSIYIIRNTATTGISEKELIEELNELILYVLNEEKKEREKAFEKYKNEISDKIHRAYGVLKEAIILESIETLELLSYLRFGAEEGILDISIDEIEKAVLFSRNPFVKEALQGENNLEKLNLKRADIIRDILKQKVY